MTTGGNIERGTRAGQRQHGVGSRVRPCQARPGQARLVSRGHAAVDPGLKFVGARWGLPPFFLLFWQRPGNPPARQSRRGETRQPTVQRRRDAQGPRWRCYVYTEHGVGSRYGVAGCAEVEVTGWRGGCQSWRVRRAKGAEQRPARAGRRYGSRGQGSNSTYTGLAITTWPRPGQKAREGRAGGAVLALQARLRRTDRERRRASVLVVEERTRKKEARPSAPRRAVAWNSRKGRGGLCGASRWPVLIGVGAGRRGSDGATRASNCCGRWPSSDAGPVSRACGCAPGVSA